MNDKNTIATNREMWLIRDNLQGAAHLYGRYPNGSYALCGYVDNFDKVEVKNPRKFPRCARCVKKANVA
jgi:hypothetical protein